MTFDPTDIAAYSAYAIGIATIVDKTFNFFREFAKTTATKTDDKAVSVVAPWFDMLHTFISYFAIAKGK